MIRHTAPGNTRSGNTTDSSFWLATVVLKTAAKIKTLGDFAHI
ncbi:hypothetical protein [Specibacter sp. NPDC078709]